MNKNKWCFSCVVVRSLTKTILKLEALKRKHEDKCAKREKDK